MLGFFVFVLLGMSPASQASEIGRWYRDVFLCAAATGVDGWKGASEGTIVALHFLVPAGGIQNACALTAVGVWQVCIVYSCLYCCELLFWIAGLSLRDLKSIYMAQTIVIFGARVLPLSPSIWNHPLSFQQWGALILSICHCWSQGRSRRPPASATRADLGAFPWWQSKAPGPCLPGASVAFETFYAKQTQRISTMLLGCLCQLCRRLMRWSDDPSIFVLHSSDSFMLWERRKTVKSQVLFQAFLVFPSPAFQAWKGRVSLRRMPKRRRSKDWFLAWPERRVKGSSSRWWRSCRPNSWSPRSGKSWIQIPSSWEAKEI